LARTWLIGRLAGHLDVVRHQIGALLELDDVALIRAVGGQERRAVERELAAFEPGLARDLAVRAGVWLICRCDGAYPARLRDLAAPPAVLHGAGAQERLLEAAQSDPVAVVGTREATPYGVEFAASLGRSLAVAGVTVVSGMARGIDSAAHSGALDGALGHTLAVLPAAAEIPYPRSARALHRRLVREACVVSEMSPGTAARRWMFPARNRIIAALCEVTVVVEAQERSGALLTARAAAGLGRRVGAVPGRVTTPQASGPLALIAGGAALVRGAQDVLELLYGPGAGGAAPRLDRPPPTEVQARLLRELDAGDGVVAALRRSGLEIAPGLAELAALELAGWVRRGTGGRYQVIP
jgi:DNA processing protein